ncbi:hypothetical protein [Paenibacillus sp. 481]|uniref:hypothetical protein n=1 Tax=Paenibacillus sp. 481 TaxID=2835869 RepID=UPI001E2EE4BA|nr:hypothetical protein [Paenibacillus sp. 481]UHA74089.1 hypothetical protein KIK04_02770 [Paenibacillus sp. 481]
MDTTMATIIAVIVMVIGMVALILTVTRKAYSQKWEDVEPVDHSTIDDTSDKHVKS